MSIFSETISKAIGNYRKLLRRYVAQSERVTKLTEMNLKDPSLYANDVALYHTAWSIIEDIEKNMETAENGYYAYSGIGQFCQYLKEYLQNYELEGNTVIHRAQKASRALVQSIQLMSAHREKIDEATVQKIKACNEVVANYGSPEQHALHQETLERYAELNEMFFKPILHNFMGQLNYEETQAA